MLISFTVIKKVLSPISFLYLLCIFFSANLYAAKIVTMPVVWYNFWSVDTGYGTDTSVENIIGRLNAVRAVANTNPVGCHYTYSNSKTIPDTEMILNGEPQEAYLFVGKTEGTCPEGIDSDGNAYGWHPFSVNGIEVDVNRDCYWPFTAKNDVTATNNHNNKMWCEYVEPETNSCGVGNPIDPISGIKYENATDYVSADGLLKVERTYVNQSIGWSIDKPIKLDVLPAGEQVQYWPDQNYKYVLNLPQGGPGSGPPDTVWKRTVKTEKLYNPSSHRIVYIWDGRKKIQFDENNSTFSSTDLAAKNMTLQAITSSVIVNAAWLLIGDNQDKHYFSATGQELRTEFANGGVLTYEYSSKGLLSAKVDGSGRRISYAYDASDRVSVITPPDGNTITYGYGANAAVDVDFLQKVSWANGESISYSYNESANLTNVNLNTNGQLIRLTGKTNASQQRIGNYKYDNLHAVSTEGFSGINKKELLFDVYSTRVTDALNSQRQYIYRYDYPTSLNEQRLLTGTSQPAGSGCNASTKNISYYPTTDNLHFTDLKKSETDFNGNKTQYAYDMTRKLETVRVEGVPSSNSTDYLPAGTSLATGLRKTSTQWHATLNKPVKVAEPRLLTTYIYNGDVDPFNSNTIAQCAPASSTALPLLCHKIQQATTDTNGASGVTATLDSTTAKREWVFTYNDRGQLLTRARAVSGSIEETREYYDTTTSLYTKGDLKKSTNVLGQATQFTQYDANGRVLKMLDVNGVETQYSYDARGRLATQSIAGATATTHSYDLNGNRFKSVLPNGVVITYSYDPMHRLTSIQNALGDKISYEYDLESNLRFERTTNASGAIGYIREHVYDALSREKNTVNSLSQSSTHLYDANGNRTGETDAKSQATTQTFDSLDQLQRTTDALSGKTDYSYDAQGRITQVKDARNNITTYTYNAFGDVVTQASPDTGTTTFTYNALGYRTKAIDARSIVTNYSYDALNRLKSVSYPAASAENVTVGYDDIATGVWGNNYGLGRITSVTNTVAATTYKYDQNGLIKMKRAGLNGIIFVTAYGYDAANNLTSITYPSGRIVNYTRDSAGRVQAVKTKPNATAAEQNVVTNINYLPFGPASSYTFGNNLSHVANYDNDYRLTGITVGGILNRSYGYDPVDNITTINNVLATTKNQTFTYDAVNRLATATGVYGNLGYSYDLVGNRLTETSATQAAPTTVTTNTYIYPATNNRLTSISKKIGATASGTRNFVYDNAGNRTQGTTEDNKLQDYTYNNANRLNTTKVTSALAGTYIYNALGQRVIKTIGTTTTKELYHYDEAGQLIAVTSASGATLREYIYNGNQLIGFVTPSPATLYYVHTDHQGTPQVVTAQNQSVAWMADYQPFGKLQSGQTNSIELYSRFPGQFLDTETGLYYNYFRDYDSSIGRYIESDPIGLNGGINTFAYVNGNPLKYIDPNGKFAWLPGVAGGAIGGIAAGFGYSASGAPDNGFWSAVAAGATIGAFSAYAPASWGIYGALASGAIAGAGGDIAGQYIGQRTASADQCSNFTFKLNPWEAAVQGGLGAFGGVVGYGGSAVAAEINYIFPATLNEAAVGASFGGLTSWGANIPVSTTYGGLRP